MCDRFCAESAVSFAPVINGEWFISDTRHGPMVHAKLGIAEENSGKLVSLVRAETEKLSTQRGLNLAIIDGPPGIGCPVIASITGADLVLIVTEPTLSGLHDLGRVAQLTKHFGIPTLVCINKWDLNAKLTKEIETNVRCIAAETVGKIRYDAAVTKAQINGQALIEYTKTGAAKDTKDLWSRVSAKLNELGPFTNL